MIVGPNGSGKSMLLNSVLSVAYLAACGVPLPCEEAEVGWCFSKDDGITLLQGDGQEVGRESSYLSMMRRYQEASSSDSAILADEVGGYTNERVGAAVGVAFLERWGR